MLKNHEKHGNLLGVPDCREFEGKRGDREVEKIFGVLERVSELRDCGLPQLVERASGGEAAKLVGALQVEVHLRLRCPVSGKVSSQVSLSMVERVQRQAETGEVEATLAASRLPSLYCLLFLIILIPLERRELKSGQISSKKLAPE